MDDLFPPPSESARQPLATRIRPQAIDEIIGQDPILAEGKLLRRLIETNRLTSIILHGPPGTGKTTIARAIANHTQVRFVELSGVQSTVKDLRETIQHADNLWRNEQRRTLLLIDEIHRFTKTQQDALLPHIERGAVQFIGATTENPYFYIISALVSRSHVFELKPLSEENVTVLLKRALEDKKNGLGEYQTHVDDKALDFLSKTANGDARHALNALELAVLTTPTDQDGSIHITLEIAAESIQKKPIVYDASGDAHYDTISAFIKTIRASEPDAALYWLAKMLTAGEDPRFIARRLVIAASEDIGLADPHALPLASACQQTVAAIGMPEARIPLAETTVYLATAPKSNAAYMALEQAMVNIQENTLKEVPIQYKNPHFSAGKKLDRGKGYKYPHSFEDAVVPKILNLPKFYEPTTRGYEKIIAERLERWENKRIQLNLPPRYSEDEELTEES